MLYPPRKRPHAYMRMGPLSSIHPQKGNEMEEPLDSISYRGYRIDVIAGDDATDTVGYQIIDPDGITFADCYGLYHSWDFTDPDGDGARECYDIIDVNIDTRPKPLRLV